MMSINDIRESDVGRGRRNQQSEHILGMVQATSNQLGLNTTNMLTEDVNVSAVKAAIELK